MAWKRQAGTAAEPASLINTPNDPIGSEEDFCIVKAEEGHLTFTGGRAYFLSHKIPLEDIEWLMKPPWDPEKAKSAARDYLQAYTKEGSFWAETQILKGALEYTSCQSIWANRDTAFGFFMGVLGHIPESLMEEDPDDDESPSKTLYERLLET